MNLYIEAVGFGVIAAAAIAIGAMGFTLQFGLTNVLNIGYGAIMSVGGFVAYECYSAGLSIWIGLFIGGLASSALTLVVAKTALSVYARRGAGLFEMAMVTFGVALIVEYGMASATQSNTYNLSLPLSHAHALGPLRFTTVQLVLVILAIVVFVALDLFLRLTRMGVALRATAVDPDLARASGISTNRVVTAAWVLSGFLCGHRRRPALPGDRLGAAGHRGVGARGGVLGPGHRDRNPGGQRGRSLELRQRGGLRAARARAPGPSEDIAGRPGHRPRADHRLAIAFYPVPMQE
jgi:predicted ABC-type sugar transport system permease subunit